MRRTITGNKLTLRAIGGLHVVTLAWTFTETDESPYPDLLGFAIERTEFDDRDQIVEQYWLRGIKRFKMKDKGMPAGSPVPLSEHPIQSFQWGDYTARPGTTYRYRLVAVTGKPKLLKLEEADSVEIDVTTEKELGAKVLEDFPEDGTVRHDVFFNRGVAGSQAYAREFGNTKPNRDDPDSEQMRWLSRGLYEALIRFIGCAKDETWAIHGMFYEFQYQPVLEALGKASATGAEVFIRYEQQSYKDENNHTIDLAGIRDICEPQKIRKGIRHNKFMVLSHKGVARGVWTGSTNISAGGIFGHSNVGHVIWNQTLAEAYLRYWNALSDEDVTHGKLRKFASDQQATPADLPPEDSVTVLFSPRDEYDNTTTCETLAWYAKLLKSAKHLACMTFAFNFDPVFQNAVNGDSDSVNYLVFDKNLEELQTTEFRYSKNTVVAAGAILHAGDLENFIGEVLTGFNKNRYIHDKFLLVDPLSEDPIIITGTANFSEPSQEMNDENMLVIRGDTRVADIYFGEFMRIFDHLYSRYVVSLLKTSDRQDPDAGFLKETMNEWLPGHFGDTRKSKRRVAFLA
jgi:phosphatidylserine/phosphatidylglycerophosphate/cardiolipin synthase-like enzyme